MRAVFWKEWREMRSATIALAVAGTVLAMGLKRNAPESALVISAIGLLGLPLGALQGFLDRRACDDEYLLHRPVSFARTHAARTLAGLASVAVVVALPLAGMLLVPYRPEPAGGWNSSGGVFTWRLNEVPPSHVLFGVLMCAAMWAAGRLGASARGTSAAVAGAILLPGALALALVRVSGDPSCVVSLAVAAFAFAVIAASVRLPARSAQRSL